MKSINFKSTIFLIILGIAFFSWAGCNDNSVTTSQADNVEFSSMSTSDSTDTGLLVITEAKLLVKDIKLNVASSSQDSTNFKVGPYVLYLNMNSSVTLVSTAYIPPGTYDKVRFMVHKLEDSEPVPDPDFADGNGRYSVIIRGTYAGVPFVYKSSKSAHQKLTFPGSLQVSASGKTNITLRIKPYIWFISGGIYLDPNVSSNWNTIDNNIKDNINNNFKCFKDDNKDGQPD